MSHHSDWLRTLLLTACIAAWCRLFAGEPTLPSDLESGLIKRDSDSKALEDSRTLQTAFGATGLDDVVMELIKEITTFNRDDHSDKTHQQKG